MRQGFATGLAVACLTLLSAGPAHANDTLNVGTAAQSLMFVPLDLGIGAGIYAREGLDVRKTDFSGAAKLNQGLAAGAMDVGLGGGTDFSFQVKGTPTKTVAGIIVSAADFGLTVGPGITSPAQLKGKRIGVSQNGTLTYWMAREFARSQGWGPDGVVPVSVGGENANHIAALLTGSIAESMWHVEIGMTLAQQKRGRVLLNAESFIPGFLANTASASNKLIAEHPDLLRRFLKGWFATVTYMLGHEDATIAAAVQSTGIEAGLLREAYEGETGAWSRTGRISPEQLVQIARAITDMGLVSSQPDLTPYYDPRFLPAEASAKAAR